MITLFMPELPEVEVTRRRIEPKLIGRRICEIHATRAPQVFLTRPQELAARLQGRVIDRLERRGKYLLIGLDDGSRVLLHLGMTGQFFMASAQSVRLLNAKTGGSRTPEKLAAFTPDKHTHLRVSFEDSGEPVFFRDTRKFGRIQWLARGASEPRIDRLGPDALTCKGAMLFEATRKRKAVIKTLLLNQSVLAGVGNIYADEALFRARIAPTRPAYQLTQEQCTRLARAVVTVLERSIETGGSSISDYIQPDGSDGAYQNERRAYARRGEPCFRCATPIVRLVLGQRSAYYCPTCQK
jgi:formamidopyrimidine-DNA glycosylase